MSKSSSAPKLPYSSQYFFKKFVGVTLAIQLGLFSQVTLAQFDDDFAPPPPPDFGGGDNTGAGNPPPNFDNQPQPGSNANAPGVGGRFGSPSQFRGESPSSGQRSAKAADGGILPKDKKDKLASAGIEDITNDNYPEIIESFDFPNAEITDIVKAISELTGKNFIIDPGVRGKITIIAPSKITVAEAYKAFLSALAINGFAVVPSGKFYKIRTARGAHRDGIEAYTGTYFPNSDQMITRVIHLKHISADTVNREIRILTSKDGELSPFPQTNSLILSDYGSNVERIMKIISQLDMPGFDDQLEVLPVKYAKSKDIADLIDKIVNKGQNKQGGNNFSAGVPRFGASQNQTKGSASFMVIPDDRTNSLIVTGNQAGLERVKKLLLQLDFRIKPEDAGGVYVYYVKNGSAEEIEKTLSGIAKNAGPKATTGSGAPGAPTISPISGVQTAPQEIFGGDVKITADKGTNSLVVVASKQDYEVVLNLLGKIDIPRDQVFVEAIITEMKITDSQSYQVGFFQFDSSGSGAKAGFNGFSDPSKLSELLNPAAGSGTILGFGSGDTVKITAPGSTTSTEVKSLMGFLNFLKTNTNLNVLSTPGILALDNQEAEIKVGDKVVVGTQQGAGQNGVAGAVTPIFEDANIELKIKPFISPSSNTIRMEITNLVKQISNAKTPTGLQSSTQPLATRSIRTNIVVNNGDTAVLGGLMKEDETESISKVPLLGDIPILGWLFKSRSTSKEKTNLVVFLTPKIIRTAGDSKKLLGDKMDERLEFIKGIGGRDPYGAKMDKLGRKAQAGTPDAASTNIDPTLEPATTNPEVK